MKLNFTLLTLGTLALLTPSIHAQTGEALFEAKCAACHVTTRPNDTSNLVAPPAMGVMKHVKMKYKTKPEAVDFVVEYALNPQEAKAVCTSDKIKRFGLMPSQKGIVTTKELHTIASWMYDNFPPKGFRGMGHGKGQGQGRGHGKGEGKSCQN